MSTQQSDNNQKIIDLELKIRQRENEIAVLKETGDAAAHQLDLDKLLNLVAERTQKLLNAETILIPVLNKDCSEYTYRAGYGNHTAEIIGQTLPLNFGICGWVWKHKKAWWQGVLNELEPDEKNQWEKQAGSYIMVPLIGKQHFLGGIAGLNKIGGGDFDKNDLDLLSMFASHITAAIENAYLYDLLQKLNAELESRVLRRTEELEIANKDLESFCYSVSHDLRAPLVSINGFSNALLDDYYDDIDGTGRDYLKRIHAASQRMDQLISDILRLSRATRSQLIAEKLNLSELVRTVLKRMQEQAPERQVSVNIEPDIYANGDPQLLSVVFDNLLANAWKYTANSKNAEISFYTKRDNNQLCYCVQDNGAGFDMKYAEKLFIAFQRLHGSEFEGSGIGLTTVQRVIRRHGGEIWADAEPGKGAKFCFTLGSL